MNYRLFLNAVTPKVVSNAGLGEIGRSAVRSPNVLKTTNMLQSTFVVQNKSSVSLVTLDRQDDFISHSLDVIPINAFLTDMFVYDDISTIMCTIMNSNASTLQLALLDSATRREKYRSMSFMSQPECVGPTGHPSCFFTLHFREGALYLWDFRSRKNLMGKIDLDILRTTPATTATYIPSSGILVIGHDNGLLSRWQVTFPYRGKGVHFLDFIRTGDGVVVNIELLRNKHLSIATCNKNCLRLLDISSTLEVPKHRSQSSFSESIIIPDADALTCVPRVSANGLLAAAYSTHIDVWHLQSKEVMYRTPLAATERRASTGGVFSRLASPAAEPPIQSLLWMGLQGTVNLLSSDQCGCVKVWGM
eukprot:Gregarina_sp_Poly_1__4610@NODE_246_length_10752_cov_151_576135_g216_i0_p3_GENE_NODE_246_length_10752_cov_151_576135_g216_i0NODE_246_length_10752_cov_151_576135_g216_i0_p3_ORF_typecomplete_len362_score29_02_NODE_246_length_10752_cov_151_576135_g216_i029724057